jgi:CRP/FNR family transcriptional regulator, cyclic AMP receptor protein
MPANEVILSLLSQASLFGGVPADDLEACAVAFAKMHFAKGKTLVVRGDPITHLYLVEDGVRLSISTVKDRKPSFCHAGPDSLFGDIAALDGEARSADTIAMMEVVVHALHCIVFCPRWSVASAIAARVVELLCARLRETTTQLESIALLPLELGFFQSELSQLLGASRPKVNAVMGLLEREGVVGRTLDRIFCNHAKLAAIARPGLDG